MKENSFVKACKIFSKYFSTNKIKNPKLESAISFLEWDIKANDVYALAKGTLFLGFLFCMLLLIINNIEHITDISYLISDLTSNNIYFIIIMLSIVMYLYIPRYPIELAEKTKRKIIFEIPDLMNYLIMYLKMNPNLERAIEFTVSKTSGILSKDLRKILWRLRTGEYITIEEGLDEFAYKWGIIAPYLKKAIMGIRGSIIESDDEKREMKLDSIMKDLLASIKDEMETQIQKIKTPSIYLYYLGVLLPLMLIILLPVGLLFVDLPFINALTISIFYCIIMPIVVYYMAQSALSNRPHIFEEYKLSKDHPTIKGKIGIIEIGKNRIPGLILSFLVFIFILLIGYQLNNIINPNLYKNPGYKPLIFYFSIPIAIIFSASVYIYSRIQAIRKLQKELEKIEDEFQDCIYILASRLGEGKPLEEALRHTYMFLSTTRSKTKELFKEAYAKVVGLGMTLKSAFFDPNYGVLRNIPSKFIKNTMEIVINSVGLGSSQAARSLISLSLQMREQQELKKYLKKLLLEITSTMMVIIVFIAPVILGISSAMQKMIFSSVSDIAQTGGISTPGSFNFQFNIKLNGKDILKKIPDFLTFIFIIFVYLIEISIILIYFVSNINYGKNKEVFLENLCKYLPIISIMYFAVVWFSGQIIGGF